MVQGACHHPSTLLTFIDLSLFFGVCTACCALPGLSCAALDMSNRHVKRCTAQPWQRYMPEQLKVVPSYTPPPCEFQRGSVVVSKTPSVS